MNLIKRLQKIITLHYLLFIALLFFAIIYSLISFVNHYNFRTYALDLGLYNNAIYDYSHFRWNYSLVFKSTPSNLLADHFELIPILIAPLQFLFGSYTLLTVQIFVILAGACGVYKYFKLSSADKNIALAASISFLTFFGIFSALSFDFHNNVIAAMLAPWFFVFVKQKKILSALLIFLLMIIAKENISLWLAFICLGLMIESRKEKIVLYFLAGGFVVSICYFLFIVSYVMPHIATEKIYTHFQYNALGATPANALIKLVSHPLTGIQNFFSNFTQDANGDYVKTELIVFLFISGFYMLLLKPQFIVMLIPIFVQKFFNDDIGKWGIYSHYAVEYAPVVIIGAFAALIELKNSKLVNALLILIVVGNIFCTVRLMDHTVLFTYKGKVRIYQASHYHRNYDVSLVHQQLNKIPSDAVVSAQAPFVPHLALRKKIYQFPIIKDADYIVWSDKEAGYPLTDKSFKEITDSLKLSSKWMTEFCGDGFNILKRKN